MEIVIHLQYEQAEMDGQPGHGEVEAVVPNLKHRWRDGVALRADRERFQRVGESERTGERE